MVQPWTAQWGQGVRCDDPSAPNIQTPIDVTTLANSVGAKLVSPLSQGEMAAIVNPAAQGWFGVDGSEINDNGCVPLDKPLDMVTIAGNSYALQREFNNAGAIETDPNALPLQRRRQPQPDVRRADRTSGRATTFCSTAR